MTRLTRVLLVVVMCCLWLPAIGAQDAPDQAGPRFRTEANYVRVDVYATRNGTAAADLKANDFELSEDGVAQKIEQFEHVTIGRSDSQPSGFRPATAAESLQAAADPRVRVFVLFLDHAHVDAGVSRRFSRPLIAMLTRLVGPNDLVAIMTSEMKASDISFARGPGELERRLEGAWWGERDVQNFRDETERLYAECYPGIPRRGEINGATDPVIAQINGANDQGIAQEMILRRREQRTLESLIDVARYLRGVREERKAILTITNGWLIYRPNTNLDRPLDRAVPVAPPVGIDQTTGKLTIDDRQGSPSTPRCEADRLSLSNLNDQQTFQSLINEANRSNASFYPIDPRGLTPFDDDIVPVAGVGAGVFSNPTLTPTTEVARLGQRMTTLRALADGTDGFAAFAATELNPAIERISADLSSYYLLGYYSTGKLDGKFHAVSVRAKPSGIQLRARRGFLAASPSIVRPAAPPPSESAQAATAAIGALATVRDTPIHVRGATGWSAGGVPIFWADLELARTGTTGARAATSPDVASGDQVDAMVVSAAGATISASRATIAPGATSVRVAVNAAGAASGEYQVMLRLKSSASAETIRLQLSPGPRPSGTLLMRSGPTTANREIPAADPRFRRTDRLTVLMPASSGNAVSARLLSRTGSEMAVPVTAGVREETDGSRWAAAQLALAPLAPGDYIVEIMSGAERSLSAFRVIP